MHTIGGDLGMRPRVCVCLCVCVCRCVNVSPAFLAESVMSISLLQPQFPGEGKHTHTHTQTPPTHTHTKHKVCGWVITSAKPPKSNHQKGKETSTSIIMSNKSAHQWLRCELIIKLGYMSNTAPFLNPANTFYCIS